MADIAKRVHPSLHRKNLGQSANLEKTFAQLRSRLCKAIVVSKRHTTNPSTRLQFILVQVHGEGPLVTMYHLCWMVTCEAKH